VDEVVVATVQGEKAARVDRAEVARVEPAVAEMHGARRRIAGVFARQPVGAQAEPAHRARRERLAVFTDDAAFDSRREAPDAARRLERVFGPQHGDEAELDRAG